MDDDKIIITFYRKLQADLLTCREPITINHKKGFTFIIKY